MLLVAGVTSSVSKSLDLRQYFERAILGCNDANDLSGAQNRVGRESRIRAPRFAAQRRRSRNRYQPVRSRFGDFARLPSP